MFFNFKNFAENKFQSLTVRVVLLFVICIILSFLIILKSDKSLRTELKNQAIRITEILNLDLVKALTGTASDVESSEYLELKNWLRTFCKSIDQCRFIYLMGARPDGTVYFFIDSEPVGSVDEAVAGDIYEPIPLAHQTAFLEQRPYTVGPYTDHWGTFISAGAPVYDNQSGKLLSVLAIDIQVDQWSLKILNEALLPLSVIFLFFIFLVMLFTQNEALKKNRNKFKFNFNFQKLVSKVSSHFIKTTEQSFDSDVNMMLAEFGAFFNVDRAYVFLFSEDMKTMSNTHEWCAAGVSSEMTHIQNQSSHSLPWWEKEILKKDYVHLPDIDQLPAEAVAEREEFKRQNIKSLLGVPIFIENRVWGFIGFDSVKRRYSWSENEIDNLKIISNLVSFLLEIHEAQKKARGLQDQLIRSEKLAGIGTLAAGVAHEINNPLQIISGYADLAKSQCKGVCPNDVSPHLEAILEAAERARKTVKSLLLYVRSDPKQNEIVDVHYCIQEATLLLQKICKNSDIKIQTDFQAPLHFIKANQGELEQVIFNLLVNSSDALLGVKNPEIAISTKNLKDKIEIIVADNGMGIPKENLSKLFTPFFTTKDPGEGTGLGLPISYSIISSFQGEIRVESEVHKKTLFFITFPIIQKEQATLEKSATAQNEIIEPFFGKALVVDDEEGVREVLSLYLSKLGLEVDQACDGEMALAKLKENQYELIITDIVMPKLNGDLLLRQIKEQHLQPNAKCIYITGGLVNYSQEQLKDLNNCSDACIYKPFSKKQVYQVVQNVLKQKPL